jgi:uncharacterized protein
MTVLDSGSGQKPLDFGSEGITGSIDQDGRIIALNSYHPQHGYVTLTAADPFPESERYNPAAVRAYRAGLAKLQGFGFEFSEPVVRREISLLQDAMPHIRLTFENGGRAEITTFACDGGAIQIFQLEGVKPAWTGRVSLQRCAYTQLTEGGPLPMPTPLIRWSTQSAQFHIENSSLGWAVEMLGLPLVQQSTNSEADGVITFDMRFHMPLEKKVVLTYGFGPKLKDAAANAKQLAQQDAQACLDRSLAQWRERWTGISPDPLLRRGLAYSLMMAVPVGEGICLLTDHMLLPLSWNRDAYYVARALLSWRPEMADIVRRHLIWMFEQAERHDGAWARCYLANGKIKDGAFQLDQQLFPLLELTEYVLETGDLDTLARLERHIQPIFDLLLRRKADHAMLFPTDETPADDPIALPYHLSSHILLWRVLTKLAALGIAGDWATLALAVRQAIDETFIAEHHGRRIYAYATDGKGRHHFYHDANDIPLVLAPTWGMVSADDPVWRATVDFAFSEENVGGAYHGRLGSIHTRAPWPLGDVQELIIARALHDPAREQKARENLRAAAQWDGALPEATDPATGKVQSRHWFAWPNAALACVELGAF